MSLQEEGAELSSEQPLVSVIIPVYNVEKYLQTTLDNVLGQSLKDIEVICVDDGSQDSSGSILASAARKDGRLHVFRQENNGAGAARNLGLSKATGRYCLFVDSDDFLENDAIERAYTAARDNDVDALMFRLDKYIEADDAFYPMTHAIVEGKVPFNEVFNPSEVPNFYKYVVGFTCCKLYKLDYLRSIGLQFPKIGAHEDMPFTYVACSKTNRAYVLPDVLYHYRRQREGSLSDGTSSQYVYMLEALECFKDDLKRTGCWAENERNYYNYVLHMVDWKFGELHGQTRAEFVDDLRNEWYERLGVPASDDDDYFYIPEEVKLLSWTRDHSYLDELEKTNERLRARLKKANAKNKKLKKELDASLLSRVKRKIKHILN